MEDPEFRPKQKNYGVCAFWCLMLVFAVIAGLIFALVYLTTIQESTDLVVFNTTTAPDTEMCETQECVGLAASLIEKMDPSVKPCDNFYEFSCGNWIKRAEVPEERGRASIPYFLLDELDKNLRYVLESPIVTDEPEATKKAKAMYTACMDKDKREQNGVDGVLSNLENDLGGWPVLETSTGGNFNKDNFDLTGLLGKLFSKYASQSLINAEASEDPNDPSQFILFIKAGSITGLPKEVYLLDDAKYKRHQDAYIKYMTDLAVAFGALDERSANLEMQAVLALEKELAQAKNDSTPTPKLVMTVAEMNTMYPKINWNDFLTTILPDDVGPVTDDFKVINQDSEYLTAAIDILSSKPERLRADWMLWLYFEDNTLYLTDEIRNIYYEYSAVITGRNPNQYFQDCVKVTNRNLQTATGRLFIDKFFAGESKSMVEEMTTDMIGVLVDLVDKSDRLDSATKQQVSEKLNEMTISIAYPDYILNDVELDKAYEELDIPDDNADVAFTRTKLWQIKQNLELLSDTDFSDEYLAWRDVTINKIDALYNSEDNSIVMNVGLLQPPFFNKNFPWYINYATMGFFIAQVASQAVTSIGTYAEEKECIRNQYGKFMIDDVALNVDHTNAEDVADNAGLQAAIQAFMNEKDEGYGTRSLPGLDMTAEELFFLSNTQVFCDKYAPESLGFYIANDPNSPGEFRATGILQNSEYFSKVFKCTADSFMNPSDKCVLLQ